MNPLEVSQRIADNYRSYLLSAFPLRDPDLRRDFIGQLESGFPLTRGPFLEASSPFKVGASIRQLIDNGVLSQGFLDLAEHLPPDRPLYVHQETAIRKAVTGRRNTVYQSEKKLWSDTVAKIPANARAHYNLAGLLAAAGKGTDAIRHYEAALRLRPQFPSAHSNLANLLFQAGDFPASRRHRDW